MCECLEGIGRVSSSNPSVAVIAWGGGREREREREGRERYDMPQERESCVDGVYLGWQQLGAGPWMIQQSLM